MGALTSKMLYDMISFAQGFADRLGLPLWAATTAAAPTGLGSFEVLPPEVAVAILKHTRRSFSNEVRLVCKRLREWHDQTVTRLHIHLDNLRTPRPWPYEDVTTPLPAGLASLTTITVQEGNPATVLQCLAHSTHLAHVRTLEFLGCVLDDGAAGGLAAALTSPHIARSLQDLHFGHCDFEVESAAPLAAAFSGGDNGNSGSGLSALQTLALVLDRPERTQVATGVLCAVLRNQQLTSLRVLQVLVCPYPWALDAAGSMQQAMALLPAAQHLSGLQELKLLRNSLRDDGATALAAALRASTELRALRVLDLRCNEITHVGASQLRDALLAFPHVPALRELGMSGNTREAVRLLAEACRTTPHLQLVKLF